MGKPLILSLVHEGDEEFELRLGCIFSEFFNEAIGLGDGMGVGAESEFLVEGGLSCGARLGLEEGIGLSGGEGGLGWGEAGLGGFGRGA